MLRMTLFALVAGCAADKTPQNTSVPIKPSSFVGRQVITQAGAYQPLTGASFGRLRLCGGGGGGGGAGGGTSGFAVGGGGASGTCLEFVTELVPGIVEIGAGGAGGPAPTSGWQAGGAGGNSILRLGSITWTAAGGLPGNGTTMVQGYVIADGGSTQTVSSDADVVSSSPGQPGLGTYSGNASPNMGASGAGGSGPMGVGGWSVQGMSNGKDARGWAAGGGGGSTIGGQAGVVGGNGSQGVLISDEYGG